MPAARPRFTPWPIVSIGKDGGAFNFFVPSGLPISPDLLCWWALEVDVYVGMPPASHLRQTRQAVDLG